MWIKGVNKIKRSRDVEFNEGYGRSGPDSDPPTLPAPVDDDGPDNKDSDGTAIYLLTIAAVTPQDIPIVTIE